MKDDQGMRHPRKHGIDIDVIRRERSMRDQARSSVLVDRQSERFKLPETPGHEVHWTPHVGAWPYPFTASDVPYIASIYRNMTPLVFGFTGYVGGANDVSNYWEVQLNITNMSNVFTAQMVLASYDMGASSTWRRVQAGPPSTTFSDETWSAVTYCLVYISIAKIGTPGAFYITPFLYYV